MFAPPAPGATPADAERALDEHLAAMATAMAVGLLSKTAFGEEGERVPLASAEDPEEALGNAELMAVVRRAIDELPENEATLKKISEEFASTGTY